jgi:hypothetical protein
VLGGPLFLMGLLLVGPLLVVEDYTVAQALREWLGLLQQHVGRIYLYEAMVFVLGIVVALPLLLPIGATALVGWGGQGLPLAALATLSVLLGLALTPLFAFLLVSNVFIYLNLRYEFYEHRSNPHVG